MQEIFIIFFGGGLGSVSRYLVTKTIAKQIENNIPIGTLTVNILGCFLIGIIYALSERYKINPRFNLLFATGFCGGFTTFSSFAYENNLLIKNQDYLSLLGYTFLSLFWGFAATYLGIFLVKKI